jgi:putative copper resistance protein D
MTPECFILARAVHFGACLLFFGVFAFDRFLAASIFAKGEIEAAVYWRRCARCFNLILLPVILLSGFAWFALVTVTMSGLPLGQALQPEPMETVLTQTQFGTVWKVRSFFWVAAMFAAIALNFLKPAASLQKNLAWLELLLGGLLLGSLAWAGHGREDSTWHLSADILHLLVAGFWPTGLFPLVLLLKKLRQTPESTNPNLIRALIRRFSGMSLVSVALLAVTGWVNAWFLAGSISNLAGQAYGRWLLVKIILFCFAVALGAVNLWRLKPRLLTEKSPSDVFHATAGQLQFNVQIELAIGMTIIVIVAILGILPPAAQ